jgi:uncharacterized membrane protein YdjX (TVP38/TMEM64 family)
MSRNRIKVALVLAVVAAVAVAYRLGWLQTFSDPVGLRRTLVELGPLGYLAFVVAYATLQPFGVPGTVFVFAAPLIWPWPIAFALSMTGTMAASVVGFSFARFVARDWVTPRIPDRFRRYEDLLARRGFLAVALLRFVFWMPPLLHASLGVSRVSFAAHFWGSLLGYALPLLAVSLFGERIFEALRRAPAGAWIAAAVTLGSIALAAVWRARRLNRRGAGPA